MLLFSSLTYYSEQIDSELLHTSSVPSPFTSIPGTFWWCMVTLSTIGYGDQIPVTALGKVTAGVSMVCAIVIMALPISVIGTQFTQRWASFSKQHKREMRTAVAFETLSRVVDNMVDHVKVRPAPLPRLPGCCNQQACRTLPLKVQTVVVQGSAMK